MTNTHILPPDTGARGHVLVFDSGVGGLTVAAELSAMAPHLTIDYAADTAFFPYGDKSDAALRARLPQVASALVRAAQPDVFVIACNTASTLALDEVRNVLDIPVIGTVPAIKPAARLTRTGTIGLLATPGTIARAYTARLISDYAAKARVISHGSQELVALAEAQAKGNPPELAAIDAAQQPLFDAEGGDAIDVIVLACTHFPLLREQLIRTAPVPAVYIDSGTAIARQTLRRLNETRSIAKKSGGCAYITTPSDRSDSTLSQVFTRFGFDKIRAISPPALSPDQAHA